MLASDFDFELPADRIAHAPARPRERARLLHVGEQLSDHHVFDLPGLLRAGDVLVANDTRVIPAQLSARRGVARIGITLDRPRADGTWLALAKNARRLRLGDTLDFDGARDFQASIASLDGDGAVGLRFNLDGAAFNDALQRAGALALPPYIDRPAGPTAEDARDYQTVFAEHEGAVAAPTAGLHFTEALLRQIDAAGCCVRRSRCMSVRELSCRCAVRTWQIIAFTPSVASSVLRRLCGSMRCVQRAGALLLSAPPVYVCSRRLR